MNQMKEGTTAKWIDIGTSTAACPIYTKTATNIHITSTSIMKITRIQTELCILQALTQISEQVNSTYILTTLANMRFNNSNNNCFSKSNINSLFSSHNQIVLMSNKRLDWIRYSRKRG